MKYEINIEIIKLQMLRKGYSITKLAKDSKLSKSTVSRVMNQIGTSRPETIYKIANVLEIDIKDITIQIY